MEDPTAFGVEQDPLVIPTMNQPGLFLLVGLLGIVGVLRLR